jgi:hypothetical protein
MADPPPRGVLASVVLAYSVRLTMDYFDFYVCRKIVSYVLRE